LNDKLEQWPSMLRSAGCRGYRYRRPTKQARVLAEQQRDLLEIVEDRYNAGSLIITSQVPIDRWYEIVGNPTLADAILDRIMHNSHRIELKGESLRKQRAAG
jgi:DNA replication protein DnaC